jgi:enoyl-CoA hydratase/carnithine racemase
MSVNTLAQSPVLIGTWPCRDGLLIGVLELNRPKVLNALNAKMVTLLHAALTRWQQDERVVCVVLRAAGDRAFCAGGDVKSLYTAVPSYGETWDRSNVKNPAIDFFTREYLLNRLIHSYPKPIIVLGQGLIIGGGLGLFANASHRVVAEDASMAMPEVGIGFIPDVASSWFLNRTPSISGEFMALTGVGINAADTIAMGLADHCILRQSWSALEIAIKHCSWSSDRDEIFAQVGELLRGRSLLDHRCLLPPKLLQHLSQIEPWFANCGQDQADIELVARLRNYKDSDPLLLLARNRVRTSCPVSIRLTLKQMQKSRCLSFQQCQQLELDLALNVIAAGHFREGVRARLIDKDSSPRWQNIECGPSTLQAYFESPWCNRPQRHPLA